MSDTPVVSGLRRPLTMDRLRSSKKPTIERVPILLDPDLAERFSNAKSEYELARIRLEAAPGNAERADEFDAAKVAYDEALAAAEDELAEFVFRSVGRARWDELVTEHRPTEEQQKKHRRANPKANPLEWNPDTFPIAAVAASLQSPELTEADVKELWDDADWNDAELASLFFAAVKVNQQRKILDRPS